MRILVVSNVYPPHHIGGYELQCERCVDDLRERGHHVDVLTSTYGLGEMRKEGDVYRTLSLSHPWYDDSHGQWINDTPIIPYNYRIATAMFHLLRPDIIFFWNPLLISLAPLVAAQDLKIPHCFYLSDDSLFRYQACDQPRWSKWPRRLLWRQRFLRVFPSIQALTPRTDSVRFENVITCSAHIAESIASHDISLHNVHVIHHGVEPSSGRSKETYEVDGPLRILFAGQVVSHKGLHVLAEAFCALMAKDSPRFALQLHIAGDGDTKYRKEVESFIAQQGCMAHVVWHGSIPHEELMSSMAEFDLYVLPSEWEEPFSIGLLEAMLAGLPVITTPTGGTLEIVRDRENALTYPKSDANSLAAAITEMAESPGLREKLGRQARSDVVENHGLTSMFDRIEAVLNGVLS